MTAPELSAQEREIVERAQRGHLERGTCKPRIYEQGTSTYVIGTEDAHTACAALGISPETHRWSSTLFGSFVRRQGQWRSASDYRPPKDAKPGVCFVGRIVPRGPVQ